ncbi:MAG: alpha/beta hydrolase [Anaerolineaceae bacterium]
MLFSLPLTRRNDRWTADSPRRFGLNYEPVEFSSRDGIALQGWWIPAEGSEKTIIFLHGYQGSMDPDLQYAPWLHDAGYNLVMFDFRAHGRSSGSITTIGALEKRDALAALEFARTRGSRKMGLLGFSMGGRVAVLAGADSELVNAVVCDCGPARISTAVALNLIHRGVPAWFSRPLAWFLLFGASLRAGINIFSNEPLEAAKRLQGKPSLFLQGAKDPNILITETRRMVKNAGNCAQLWLVEDAGHRDISDIHPIEYRTRILEFFNLSMST